MDADQLVEGEIKEMINEVINGVVNEVINEVIKYSSCNDDGFFKVMNCNVNVLLCLIDQYLF